MAVQPVNFIATTEELTKLATQFQEEMVIKLTQNGSNVTGKLANSIKVGPAQSQSGKIVLPLSMLEYGLYVDNGAERGRGKQPPVQAIVRWIKQKRIKPPKGFTVDQFAWAIAKNIGDEGQRFKKARPFIEPALRAVEQNKGLINGLLEAASKDIESNLIENINQMPGLKVK